MSQTIDAHRGLIIGKLRHVQTIIVPTSVPPHVTLSVDNGLQSGAARAFETDVLHVGSGPDDDLTLPDDGIASGHVSLAFGTTLFGDIVTVKAQADHVKIDGVPIEAGTLSMPRQLPVKITVGGIDVTVAPAKVMRPSQTRGRTQSVAVRWGIKLPLMLICGLLLLSVPLGFNTNRPLTVVPGMNVTSQTELVTQTKPAIETKKALREKLAENNLAEYLNITDAQDGAIYVDGTLPAGRLADWRDIHLWFDTLGSSITLLQRVRVSPLLGQFPAIAAVRFGPDPELIFANGNRAKIGSVVQDGWSVAKIGEVGFSLERGLEAVEIAF